MTSMKRRYADWLQARIAQMRLERRRGQWRRYSASAKGRARQDRYENTVQGSTKRTKRQCSYHIGASTERLAYLTALLEGQVPA